jgi:FkbM family methyltransferase
LIVGGAAMKKVSYAQNGEDIVLWRALGGISNGFYIDVGANDPIKESVTKLFYDAGWSGINIEPLAACHKRLQHFRERDVNLQMLVGREEGRGVLHECVEDSRYSTVDIAIADRLKRECGLGYVSHDMPVATLTALCEKHAQREIHFLKLDVEGHEAAVLGGLNLSRHRPWILVVEATEPNSQRDSSSSWEAPLVGQGYLLALFDGLSRFYVAEEHAELMPLLRVPANIFDNYMSADEARMLAELKQTSSIKWLLRRAAKLGWSRVGRALRFQ